MAGSPPSIEFSATTEADDILMSDPKAHDLGLHRVIEPQGALPQAAQKLDATAAAYDNEVVIDVETLNVDSASFEQIVDDVGRDEEAVARRIASIVAERGKMQNPVTGSGGMLLGTVAALGPDYKGPVPLSPGDRVATLVSLTLTPLSLTSIDTVRLDADQVDVVGRAYLWPSSPIVALPDDLDDRVALSALDVCGAPAQARRLAADADTMVILGAGKSGMICAAAARDLRGEEIAIYGLDRDVNALEAVSEAGFFDDYRSVDARRPVEVLEAVESMTDAQAVDVVINTCNVSGTEMSAILPVRQEGTVYFFNMATDFSRAALGCEGVGRDAKLLIGNGYVGGHAQMTLDILRRHSFLRRRLATIVGA